MATYERLPLPISNGNYAYLVSWDDPHGCYRPEPVGYRRGQVWRCSEERLTGILHTLKEE